VAENPPNSEYRLDWMSQVPGQIRDLAAKASRHGRKQEFLDALADAVHRLKSDPLTWGDPERNTRKKGGAVCHGTLNSLIVQFAVYQIERAVIILDVKFLIKN
jgi:hypothetical protein